MCPQQCTRSIGKSSSSSSIRREVNVFIVHSDRKRERGGFLYSNKKCAGGYRFNIYSKLKYILVMQKKKCQAVRGVILVAC